MHIRVLMTISHYIFIRLERGSSELASCLNDAGLESMQVFMVMASFSLRGREQNAKRASNNVAGEQLKRKSK